MDAPERLEVSRWNGGLLPECLSLGIDPSGGKSSSTLPTKLASLARKRDVKCEMRGSEEVEAWAPGSKQH